VRELGKVQSSHSRPVAQRWCGAKPRSSAWKLSSTSGPANRDFCWTTSLVLAVTVVIIPTIAPYNQPLLIPGAFLVALNWAGEHGTQLLRTNLFIRIFRGVAAACFVWQWISAFGLASASFFTSSAQNFWRLPLWASILSPVSVTACLALMICFPAKTSAIDERVITNR